MMIFKKMECIRNLTSQVTNMAPPVQESNVIALKCDIPLAPGNALKILPSEIAEYLVTETGFALNNYIIY
jgi:hypothetical protein